MTGMDVTVLAIPGCPGALLLEQRLAAATRGLTGIRITRQGNGSLAPAPSPGDLRRVLTAATRA